MIPLTLLALCAGPPLLDPLPPGVLAELGTQRLNYSYTARDVAFLPDGRLLTCGNGGLSIWNAQTGRLLDSKGAHGWCVPVPGGLVLAGERNVLLIPFDGRRPRWNAACPEMVQLACGHDGSWFVRSDPEGSAHVCSLRDASVMHVITPGGGAFLRLAASPVRPQVAFLDARGDVSLWDRDGAAPRWKSAGHTPRAARSGQGAVAFHPDGSLLATAGIDGTIRLWNANSGAAGRVLRRGPEVCYALAVSREGLVAASLADKTVRLFDSASGKETRVIETGAVQTRLSFSPDGLTLASIGSDNQPYVALWDVRTGRRLLEPPGHQGTVYAFRHGGGRRLVSIDSRNAVIDWHPSTGKLRTTSLEAGPRYSWGRDVSPDGRLACLARRDGVRLYDAITGKEKALLNTDGSPGQVRFTHDGQGVLATVGQRYLAGWRVADGRPLFKPIEVNDASTLWPSPDGRRCLVSNRAGRVVVADLRTGEASEAFDNGGGLDLALAPDQVAWSRDGSLVASASRAGVKVLEARRWRLVTEMKAPPVPTPGAYWPQSVAFSPDGRLVAAVGYNTLPSIYEVGTGGLVWEARTRPYVFTRVAFLADSRSLAAVSQGSAIVVWSLRPDGVPPRLEESALERCWRRLAGGAAEAHRSAWELAAAPEGVKSLAERLKPQRGPDAAVMKRLLDALDSDEEETRGKAQEEIISLGPNVIAPLRRHLASKPPLEVVKRLDRILTEVQSSREALRLSRAVMALELAATPEARALLKTLAAGEAKAPLTEESKSALARIAAHKE